MFNYSSKKSSQISWEHNAKYFNVLRSCFLGVMDISLSRFITTRDLFCLEEQSRPHLVQV
jgi:hypothetical protein